ncbi:MAG TPA: creatininase family protein [candidate division Zixibacteria bacterium]|jgi:creatinine amidohydrolase
MPTYWENLNWAEFQEAVPAAYRTAMMAIGTLEGHGVGPLGTDNIIPIDLVDQIADDLHALVCPPIHYGQVKGLAAYPGAVPVDEEIFADYCASVFSGIASWGFDSLIVINGHGGNTQTLKAASWEAHRRTGMKILVVDWWLLAAPVCEEVYGQAGGHAGTDENGYVLAIRPDTIHADAYSERMIYQFAPGVTVYPYPGPILTTKAGEGAPDFDVEKAKRYRQGAIATVRDFCRSTLDGWDAMGL